MPSAIVYSDAANGAASLEADYVNTTYITVTDDENQVKITSSGTYVVSGSSTDGNITVKKGTTGVVLVLENLDLTSTTGATVSVNKEAEVKVIISGDVVLTDNENPDDEYSADETAHEVLTAPHILEGDGEPDEDTEGVYFSVMKASRERSDRTLKEEIYTANETLMEYDFRFYELTECSLQQDKTREQCATAIRYMLDEYPPILLEKLVKKKKLPVKELSQGSGVSKKTIDRYRKYIIMAIIILRGDYPHIAEYLKFVREEPSK